jgi:hypothetical protein
MQNTTLQTQSKKSIQDNQQNLSSINTFYFNRLHVSTLVFGRSQVIQYLECQVINHAIYILMKMSPFFISFYIWPIIQVHNYRIAKEQSLK